MPRLDKTLADYVAIAISPALIMLMVGSLMWFLVAVFYQGHYDGRIYWILACFTMAIVLIARIGIEEGQERATLFGVPLAIAVGLATMRFSSSMYFHWILLGIAWWAAHKLTWDCTLIDEEQDSSGQGLLQFVGFGKKPPETSENGKAATEKKDEEPAEPEGVTDRVSRMREEAHPKRKTKGKAHTPGVWIVYFSLAALPLFGLGQILVPVGDSATRLWTFQLLATYVAAGLGLLVTTSFVGLRRYLRQRGVQMPPQMAGVWIALGAAIIVALLAVCAILPRPAAEYEIARMPDFPLKFTTPERESNRHAMGEEGADKNDPESQSRTQGKQDGSKPEGGKSDDPESGGKKGSNAKEGAGDKKSSDGKSQGSSKEKKQGQSESKQDSSQRQQGDSQQQGQKQDSQSGDKSSSQQNDSQQQSSDQRESRQKQSSNQKQGEGEQQRDGERQQNDERRESTDDMDDTERNESENQDSEEQSQRDNKERSESRSESDDSRQSGDSQRTEDQAREDEKDAEEEQDRSGSSSGSKPKPDSPSFQLPQVSFTGGLFGMLKFVVYVVLACVGIWWLWKNWSRVVEGFRLFLQELRDLWASLFGRKPKAAGEEAEEQKPAAKPERPFADYVDPFAAGLAARYAPDELVRYTFEATEAWARENGCHRDPDQTPHEFAARIRGHVESLGPGAVILAKLYCQAAYAPGSLAPAALTPLADFWARLRASHRTATKPPPVQAPTG